MPATCCQPTATMESMWKTTQYLFDIEKDQEDGQLSWLYLTNFVLHRTARIDVHRIAYIDVALQELGQANPRCKEYTGQLLARLLRKRYGQSLLIVVPSRQLCRYKNRSLMSKQGSYPNTLNPPAFITLQS